MQKHLVIGRGVKILNKKKRGWGGGGFLPVSGLTFYNIYLQRNSIEVVCNSSPCFQKLP